MTPNSASIPTNIEFESKLMSSLISNLEVTYDIQCLTYQDWIIYTYIYIYIQIYIYIYLSIYIYISIYIYDIYIYIMNLEDPHLKSGHSADVHRRRFVCLSRPWLGNLTGHGGAGCSHSLPYLVAHPTARKWFITPVIDMD